MELITYFTQKYFRGLNFDKAKSLEMAILPEIDSPGIEIMKKNNFTILRKIC